MPLPVDRAFLIDVSEEDDSLLPVGNTLVRRNADDAEKPPSGCLAESADAIKKDGLLCQQGYDGNPEEPGNPALPVTIEEPPLMTEEPVLGKKKKKGGFNVRKSLAWNNAFLTEEGVLDSEELSLVNKTFQKPPGLPKPGIFMKLVQVSKPVKPPVMPKLSLISRKADLTAESMESQRVSALVSPSSSTDSLIESLPKSSEQHHDNAKGPNRVMHGASTPTTLSNLQIDTAVKEKALVEAFADSSEEKPFARRSVDKKDQSSSLPGIREEDHFSVFEGDSNKLAAVASDSFSSKGAPYLKQIRKDRSRGVRQSTSEEAVRQSSLMKLTGDPAVPRARSVPSSIKFTSEPASTKIQHATKNSASFEPGTFAARDRPSGLRMPSPKLGFFDTSRTASQLAMPREKSGHAYGVNGVRRHVDMGSARYTSNQSQAFKQSSASAKASHQLLEASSKQGVEARKSSSIPSAPHVLMRVTSAQELSRSVSYPSNRANKQLDSVEQVLKARKNGQNGSTQGKPAALSQPGYSIVRNNPGQENLSPDCKDGKVMLQKSIATQALAFENPT